MRCFNVLVHGRIRWLDDGGTNPTPVVGKPAGFYCHRHVLASSADLAKEKAIRRVRENLDAQTGWIGKGRACVDFLVEEVSTAPLFKGFLPDNRGHTFYEEP